MANEFKTWIQEKNKGGSWSAPMSLRSGYGGVISTGAMDLIIITTLVNPVIFEINNTRYREIQQNLHAWTISSMLGSHGPSQELAEYALKQKWATKISKRLGGSRSRLG